MSEMTIERAVDNAIASAEMEGFNISKEQRILITKLFAKEITVDEAVRIIQNKSKSK